MLTNKNIKIKKLLEKYKDDRFYKEVFETETYAPVKNLKKLDTVIDLGALSGEFSFWIADKAKIVFAIEPEPEQYKELVDNVRFTQVDNIFPFKLALSNVSRKGHVTIAGRGGATLSEDQTITSRDVVVETLAQFMKRIHVDHVDVLKVDIECGEKEVFEASDFEEVADEIDFIIGEHVGATSRERLESLGFKYQDYEFGSYFYKETI